MYFYFDDLNFLNNCIFKEIEELCLSNVIYNDIGKIKEKFPNFKKLILNEIELLDLFEERTLYMENIATEGDKIKINFIWPYTIVLFIDKIEKIKIFNGCREIYLNNLQLCDEDIKFLDNKKLNNLKILNLDGNKITNLNILEYINPNYLDKLSLKNNLINSGIEIINNNKDYKLQFVEVKLKENDQNSHLISFEYSKGERYDHNPLIYFDYIIDINKSLDIFKELNFEKDFRLDLSGIKLKNLNFLENGSFKYLSEIILDNNLIDDISIFEKINYFNTKIKKFSLKENPIRKGLHALKSQFFRSMNIELDVEKKENEYKIISGFKKPCIDIEFYINNINEITDIFDFDNDFITITKNNPDALKLLENILLINKNGEQNKMFELINLFVDFFENTKGINIVKERNNFELIENNNIIFNDKNKESLEKVFTYLKTRNAYDISIYKLNLKYLDSDAEKIIQHLTFLHITNLIVTKCNLDLGILNYLDIKNLDLSQTTVHDIKGICQLSKLEILNLSNNPNIKNLYELKNAKFKNLKELNLSNDNLDDLDKINMSEYKFDELEILDLRNNKIKFITPVKRTFKSLRRVYLENNNIREAPIFNEDFISPYINYCMWDFGTYIK